MDRQQQLPADSSSPLTPPIVPVVGGMAAPAEPSCTFAARRDLSLPKVAMTVLGVAIFTHAHTLTASPSFRLGAGALTFASGAVLVLVFILMRSVPHKRKIAAALAVSASSALGALRWAYGTWAPDLATVLTSRAAVVYFLVTGLLGLAVTYWLDDTANVKLNNTVRAVLHLSGLLLVFLGTTSEPASLALIALLVASRVLAPVARRVPGALRWLGQRLGVAVAALVAAVRRLAAAAAANAKARRAAVADYSAVQPSSPAAKAGGVRRRAGRRQPGELLLSEDEEQEAAEEARRLRKEREAQLLRSQGEGEGSRWLNGGSRGQGEQQQQQQQGWRWPSDATEERPKPVQKQQPQRPVSPPPVAAAPAAGGGWFSRWSGGSQPAPAPAPAPSPLHLRTPPPNPAAVQQAAAKQERATPTGRKQAAAADESSGEDEGPQRSPWSQERLVVDISSQGARRAAPSGGGRTAAAPTSPAPARSGAARTPTGAAAGGSGRAAGGGGDVSPLVAMGKIFNAESSRVILIGKGKYEELVSRGYTPDFKNGVLLPPGGSGGSGSGAAAADEAAGTPKRAAARSRRG